MNPQDLVYRFHEATGAGIGETPAIRNWRLRYELIEEEAQEFRVACATGSLVSAIDALCDLLYVTYGAAVEFGVELEPFFNEVHRSNMTKVGGPVREDGKRLKPSTYQPPNLDPILADQMHGGHIATNVFAADCEECSFERSYGT